METIHRDFIDAWQRFDHWLTTSLFPKWAAQGFAENGAALECFDGEGKPDWQADKRMRVQSRQIFSMCYGYKKGFLPEGKALAQATEKFISNACPDALPGFYPMTLDASDKVKNAATDLYDVAFFLLAYSWQKDALNDEHALLKAKNLALHVDTVLKSDHGGWLEGTYAHTTRRQNPHMHLFEAFIHLYRVSNDTFWLERCHQVYSLFEQHFFDAQHGVLLEFFTTDWQPCPGDGKSVEPGHMMEWVWLLHEFQTVSGTDTTSYQSVLYRHARDYGLTPGNRWLHDTVTPEGTVVSSTFKSWPMTEWIKAALVHSTLPDNANREQDIASATFAIHQLIDGFSHPQLEAHYTYVIDSNGQPVDPKMAASTLYHLCMAHNEASRFAAAFAESPAVSG